VPNKSKKKRILSGEPISNVERIGYGRIDLHHLV